MSDIVERLLKRGANAQIIKEKPDLHYDAVYEIERLRAENERLREALKPFATEGKYIQASAHDGDFHIDSFTVGDFRAARTAMGDTE